MLGLDWEGFDESVMVTLPAFAPVGRFSTIGELRSWASSITGKDLLIYLNGSRLPDQTSTISTLSGQPARTRLTIVVDANPHPSNHHLEGASSRSIAPSFQHSTSQPGFTCFHTAFHSYFFGPGLPPAAFQQPSYNFGQIQITPAGVTLNGSHTPSATPLPFSQQTTTQNLADSGKVFPSSPSPLAAYPNATNWSPQPPHLSERLVTHTTPSGGAQLPKFTPPIQDSERKLPIKQPTKPQPALVKKPIKVTNRRHQSSSDDATSSSESDDLSHSPIPRTKPNQVPAQKSIVPQALAKQSEPVPKHALQKISQDALGKRVPAVTQDQDESSSDQSSELEPVLIGAPETQNLPVEPTVTYPVKTKYLQPGDPGIGSKTQRYDGLGAFMSKFLVI